MEISIEQSQIEQSYGNLVELDKPIDSNDGRKMIQKISKEEKYNIPEIVECLKSISGREVISEVSKLLKEKKVLFDFY
jgi:hypothetical protein